MPVKNRDKSIKKRAMKAHRKTNKRQKKHSGGFSFLWSTNSAPSNSAANGTTDNKPSASTSSSTFSDYLSSWIPKTNVVNDGLQRTGGRKKRHRRTTKTE